MRSGVEPAGVSLKGTVGVSKLRRPGSHMVYASQERTSVNVSERVNDMTDGMVRSLNATTRGGNGSILEIPDQYSVTRRQWEGHSMSLFRNKRVVFMALLAVSLGAWTPRATAAEQIVVVDTSPINWLFITWNTMEELVRVDKDGKLAPALAESWKWVDDKTLEFKLRKGVKFQDGEPFNAKTFRRSFDEVQRWEVPHPPGAFLNFPKSTKLDIVGDYTVRFSFPAPDVAALMKFRGMHIASTRFWNELGFIDKKSKTAERHW